MFPVKEFKKIIFGVIIQNTYLNFGAIFLIQLFLNQFFQSFEWKKVWMTPTFLLSIMHRFALHTHCANCEMFASSITCITFHIWNSQKKLLGRRKLYFHFKRLETFLTLKIVNIWIFVPKLPKSSFFEFSCQKLSTSKIIKVYLKIFEFSRQKSRYLRNFF